MGGGSGEYLARRLFFTLETSGAGVALADQIRTLEDTPPGGVRVSFAASDPGPGVDADGVILVDGADGTWAVERARGLHEAGFHGLVVAVSPVPCGELRGRAGPHCRLPGARALRRALRPRCLQGHTDRRLTAGPPSADGLGEPRLEHGVGDLSRATSRLSMLFAGGVAGISSQVRP